MQEYPPSRQGKFEYIEENLILITHPNDRLRINLQLFSQLLAQYPAFINFTGVPNGNLSISSSNELFYTQLFNKGKKILRGKQILIWLLELILPIKFLHDNNIYYHNLSASNLLFGKNNRLILGPANFPFSQYYEELHPTGTQMVKHLQHINCKQIKEFPQLTVEVIQEELKGIFELWYEFCTGVRYNIGEDKFMLIEERYGAKWRIILQSALTNSHLDTRNLKDLYSIIYKYIHTYIYIYII